MFTETQILLFNVYILHRLIDQRPEEHAAPLS